MVVTFTLNIASCISRRQGCLEWITGSAKPLTALFFSHILRKALGLLSGAPIFRSKYPQPHYAFMRRIQTSSVYNCTDQLHELHFPTLIMHGKKDKNALCEWF